MKRYEIKVSKGNKIVHRVWEDSYEVAMDLLDLAEENWNGYKVEFTDHKLYSGKVR